MDWHTRIARYFSVRFLGRIIDGQKIKNHGYLLLKREWCILNEKRGRELFTKFNNVPQIHSVN